MVPIGKLRHGEEEPQALKSTLESNPCHLEPMTSPEPLFLYPQVKQLQSCPRSGHGAAHTAGVELVKLQSLMMPRYTSHLTPSWGPHRTLPNWSHPANISQVPISPERLLCVACSAVTSLASLCSRTLWATPVLPSRCQVSALLFLHLGCLPSPLQGLRPCSPPWSISQPLFQKTSLGALV